MFRMCASNSHSYTHLIQALCIVRKPTVWVFITSKYPGTHDIGLPTRMRTCEPPVQWNVLRLALLPSTVPAAAAPFRFTCVTSSCPP